MASDHNLARCMRCWAGVSVAGCECEWCVKENVKRERTAVGHALCAVSVWRLGEGAQSITTHKLSQRLKSSRYQSIKGRDLYNHISQVVRKSNRCSFGCLLPASFHVP